MFALLFLTERGGKIVHFAFPSKQWKNKRSLYTQNSLASEKEWRTVQNIVPGHGLHHIPAPLWKLTLHFCTWKFRFIFIVGYENCHSVFVLFLHLLPLGVLHPIRAGKYVSENKSLLLLIPGKHKIKEWIWRAVMNLSEIRSYLTVFLPGEEKKSSILEPTPRIIPILRFK